MGILSYFGPLVLIPVFLGRDDELLRFHANQGLILFLAFAVLFALLYLIPFAGPVLFCLGSLAILLLDVLGIFSVCGGSLKPLPLLAKLPFRLLK